MTKIMIILKNNWRYSGELINETNTHLILRDVKLGEITISKDTIAMRTNNGGRLQ